MNGEKKEDFEEWMIMFEFVISLIFEMKAVFVKFTK